MLDWMYGTILFAVDDDEALPPAIPLVAAYARRVRGRVSVLHVQRAEPRIGFRPRLVTIVVEQLWSSGVDACGEVRTVRRGDDVADLIAKAARTAGADLVAMGAHGAAGLGAAFLGSVSHRVAAGLEVPVLVSRGVDDGPGAPRRVLVAVGGSPLSTLALTEAVSVARTFGAHVRVVHVADGPAGADVVETALAFLRARGVEGSGERVVSRSVAAGIAAAADRLDADLVVLGGPRPAELGGLLLDDVAQQVLRLERRPVLLARSTEAPRPVRRRSRDLAASVHPLPVYAWR
jgi:nucleotide-binding universal stress UspA family protein